MKFNWKLRLFNKQFWLASVPAILLLVQAVMAPFGYKWDFANIRHAAHRYHQCCVCLVGYRWRSL
jgi:phi LC3 family holin